MRLISVTTASLLVCLFASCTGRTYSRNSRATEPEYKSKVMFLYRIDVDKAAVKKGARLLFAEPPPNYQYGTKRRAQGFFSVSDAGSCRIEVKCAEPVVGLNGRRDEQIYTLLKFYGHITSDGKRATTTQGETAAVSSGRSFDEVHFIERGDDKITVQAYFDGKPTAYLLHFTHAAIGSKTVPMPWK